MLSHGCLATITAVTLFAAACRHSDAPSASEPGEAAPLPPASGTPIGFLVDDAAELQLSPDQVARLKQIDDDLAGRLEAIEGQMRAAQRPVEPDGDGGMQGRGGRSGGMGGGMRGGGRPGGRGMAGSGGGPRQPHGGGPRQPHGGGRDGASGPAAAGRLGQQREDEVRDAFARAFMIMDASQQEAARKLLESHDIDIEQIGVPSPASSPPSHPAPATSQ